MALPNVAVCWHTWKTHHVSLEESVKSVLMLGASPHDLLVWEHESKPLPDSCRHWLFTRGVNRRSTSFQPHKTLQAAGARAEMLAETGRSTGCSHVLALSPTALLLNARHVLESASAGVHAATWSYAGTYFWADAALWSRDSCQWLREHVSDNHSTRAIRGQVSPDASLMTMLDSCQRVGTRWWDPSFGHVWNFRTQKVDMRALAAKHDVVSFAGAGQVRGCRNNKVERQAFVMAKFLRLSEEVPGRTRFDGTLT